MAFLRIFGLVLIMGILAPVVEADSNSFDQFAQGAMTVYSTFKDPSKKESEQFYTFIKSKWQTSGCLKSCTLEGKAAGKEYVHRMNVQIEPDHS